MSFDAQFDLRWRDVIVPAIRNVGVNDHRLEPIRVDTRKISDSILTEILSGIADSRLIFADVTTIGYLEGRPIRNGNVMYEVGLAQSARLPEEVILFRSDDDLLLFDTSTVRINSYAPDTDVEKSRLAVTDVLLGSLQELDLRRHLAVRKAVEALDYPSWWLLAESGAQKSVTHPKMRTMRDVLGNAARTSAISRLLEMGALRTTYVEITPELLAKIGDAPDYDLLKYECTEFGAAIIREAGSRMGMLSPELGEALAKQFPKEQAK